MKIGTIVWVGVIITAVIVAALINKRRDADAEQRDEAPRPKRKRMKLWMKLLIAFVLVVAGSFVFSQFNEWFGKVAGIDFITLGAGSVFIIVAASMFSDRWHHFFFYKRKQEEMEGKREKLRTVGRIKRYIIETLIIFGIAVAAISLICLLIVKIGGYKAEDMYSEIAFILPILIIILPRLAPFRPSVYPSGQAKKTHEEAEETYDEKKQKSAPKSPQERMDSMFAQEEVDSVFLEDMEDLIDAVMPSFIPEDEEDE